MHDLQLYVLAPQKETLFSLFLDLVIAFFDWFVWFAATFGTLLSVFVAIGLYLWKVRLDKINAARILLMEIRHAEKAFRDIRNLGTVAEMTFIMPVSSWAKLQHYFIRDLSSIQLDQLNDFFNLSIMAQKEVDRLKNQWPTSNEEKIRVTQQLFGSLAKEFETTVKDVGDDEYRRKRKEYEMKRDNILQILNDEVKGFEPDLPKIRLQIYTQNLQFISGTTCGDKLEKIAKLP